MDLSKYSDEELMQIAGINKPQQNDLSGYSDEELMKIAGIEPKSALPVMTPEKQQEAKPLQVTPEQMAKLQEIRNNRPSDSELFMKSLKGQDIDKAMLKGAATGLERMANGATFGAYDWASDKLGLGAKERAKELEQAGGTIPSIGLEIVGGLPLGTLGYKGIGELLKRTPKIGQFLSKYGTLPTTGAVEGGVYSGFNTNGEDIASGVLWGVGLSGALGALGKGVGAIKNKLLPDFSLKNIKPTLEGAVESQQGRSLLNKGIRKSNIIANEVYNQSQGAMTNVNRQANSVLQNALGENRLNIDDELAKAKKSYADYIDEYKGERIVEGKRNPKKQNDKDAVIAPKAKDLGLHDKLSNYQKNALNSAWKSGADRLKKGEITGSLKHIDKVKATLNDMIENSKVPNPNGLGTVATPNTVDLREIKDLLKDTMNKAGLAELNKEYARAKGLQSLFTEGKNFNPNKNTLADFKLDNADKKSAFLQGIVDKLTTNPDANNMAENALRYSDAIKKLSPQGKYSIQYLGDLSRKHKDIGSLATKAYNKISAGEKDGRGFIELLESAGSLAGGIKDAAGRKAYKNSIEKAAMRVLNNKMPDYKPGLLERTLFKNMPKAEKKKMLEYRRAITPEISSQIINSMENQ